MAPSVAVSPTTPYGPLVESRVRVVTWNLWWRLGDWTRRASAIAETLEALHASELDRARRVRPRPLDPV